MNTRITVVAVIGMMVCGAARAEEADTVVMSGHVEEIVVPSVKTNRHNLTPASVSVVGPQLLRTQQVTEMTDLTGVLPNFYVADYGSKQTSPIAIRGIMSKMKGTAVGFYIDGVPHFEVSSFDADMMDVKAIEVYRGPQGTLYGRNTLGGVINIYTMTPFDSEGTRVRVSVGQYGLAGAQASFAKKIGERMGVSVGGYARHRDGYFRNICLDKKADPVNEAGGKIGLHLRPADGWAVRLTSNVDFLDQGGYPYAVYDEETGKAGDVNYNRESGFRRLLSTNGLGVTYQGDGFVVNSQTSYQYLDEQMDMDQDATPADTYMSHFDVNQGAVSEEITIKSDGSNSLQWVGGVFLFRQWRENVSTVDYLKQKYSSVNEYDIPTSGVGVFAQMSYNIWRGLSVTAGLRFDHEKSTDDYDSYKKMMDDGARVPKTDFDSEMTSDVWLPKIGLQYKWGERNLAFGNITRGCKAGGFNSVFEKEDERSYQDESAWNYELGVRMCGAARRLEGELTLFYIDWRDQHISRAVPGVGSVICNAGHSVSKGLEASVTWRPVMGLTVVANYGYTYAQFEDYKKSDKQDYSGNMLPLVPRNTLTGMASYTFAPRVGLDLVTVGANVNGVGKLYWLEDNAVCQSFYAQLGAKISLQKSIFTLDIWGRNLTGTEYLSYYYVASGRFAQKGVPANIGATVSLKL